jgi:Trk K+ transport system NAD-binding subunit
VREQEARCSRRPLVGFRSGVYGRDAMLTVVGSGHLAERIARHLGRTQRVARVPSPPGGSAEARLTALGTIGEPQLVLAATDDDERNLITAAIAKQRLAARTAAVVQSPSLAAQRELVGALRIDRIIRPQAVLAASLASHTRGAVASAVQSLGRGRIRVAELQVGPRWRATDATLRDLALPAGARIAVVHRGDDVVAPSATARVRQGDRLLLVANEAVLAEAVDRLGGAKQRRNPGAVVVADAANAEDAAGFVEALRDLEIDAGLAGSASLKQWSGKPEILVLFRTGQGANALLGATPAGAKVFAVSDAEDETPSSWIRLSAPQEIARTVVQMLPRPPVERVGTIAAGVLSVYRVEAGDAGEWLELPLRELAGMRGWTVLAIQAGTDSHLPHPEDVIMPRDVLIIAGPPDGEAILERALRGG